MANLILPGHSEPPVAFQIKGLHGHIPEEVWIHWMEDSVKAQSYLAAAMNVFPSDLNPAYVASSGSRMEENLNFVLGIKIENITHKLSALARKRLWKVGIVFLAQLVQRTENDLFKTKTFGRKTLKEINDLLAYLSTHYGVSLHLGMKLPDWKPPLSEPSPTA